MIARTPKRGARRGAAKETLEGAPREQGPIDQRGKLIDPFAADQQRADPAEIGEKVVFKLWSDGAVKGRAIEQARREAGDKIRLDQALTRLRLADPEPVAAALAAEIAAPLAEDRDYPAQAVLAEELPGRFVSEALALPLSDDGKTLILAMADPLDDYTLRAIAMKTRRRLAVKVACAKRLETEIERLYKSATAPRALTETAQRRLPPPAEPAARPAAETRRPAAPERRSAPPLPAAKDEDAAALMSSTRPNFIRPRRITLKDAIDRESDDRGRRPAAPQLLRGVVPPSDDAPPPRPQEPAREPGFAAVARSARRGGERGAPQRTPREEPLPLGEAERTRSPRRDAPPARPAFQTPRREAAAQARPKPRDDAWAPSPRRSPPPPIQTPSVQTPPPGRVPPSRIPPANAAFAGAPSAEPPRPKAPPRAPGPIDAPAQINAPKINAPKIDAPAQDARGYAPGSVAAKVAAQVAERRAERERRAAENGVRRGAPGSVRFDELRRHAAEAQGKDSAARRRVLEELRESMTASRISRRQSFARPTRGEPAPAAAPRQSQTKPIESGAIAPKPTGSKPFFPKISPPAQPTEPRISAAKRRIAAAAKPAQKREAETAQRVAFPGVAALQAKAQAEAGGNGPELSGALGALAKTKAARAALAEAAQAASGLILIVGPSGAGKTATVKALAALRAGALTKPERFDAPGVRFPRGEEFRVFWGEIRDAENAESAARAAMAGALVIASLDAASAAAAAPRMIALGLPPYALASSLKAVLAQTLVERDCTRCAGTGRGAMGGDCPECAGEGRLETPVIAEALVLNDATQALILTNAPEASFSHAIAAAESEPQAAAGAR